MWHMFLIYPPRFIRKLDYIRTFMRISNFFSCIRLYYIHFSALTKLATKFVLCYGSWETMWRYVVFFFFCLTDVVGEQTIQMSIHQPIYTPFFLFDPSIWLSNNHNNDRWCRQNISQFNHKHLSSKMTGAVNFSGNSIIIYR